MNPVSEIVSYSPVASPMATSSQPNFSLSFSTINSSNPTKSYIPDFVYNLCADDTQQCDDICSNNVFSPVVDGYVHDPRNGKVFCPFGKGETMNQSIVYDQSYINSFNSNNITNFATSTWGHAPQMDPRSLSKVGLSWRTS